MLTMTIADLVASGAAIAAAVGGVYAIVRGSVRPLRDRLDAVQSDIAAIREAVGEMRGVGTAVQREAAAEAARIEAARAITTHAQECPAAAAYQTRGRGQP